MKIENYGIIGDMHTSALIGIDGSLDWLCLPSIRSDACFAALLGEEGNGAWKICPEGQITATRRGYRDNTLILETEFTTATGKVRLTDFMPTERSTRHVVRIVEGLSGEVAMQLRLTIRFDYGRTVPWVRQLEDGTLFAVAGPNALSLHTSVPIHGENLSSVAQFSAKAGERHNFVLTWYHSYEEPPPALEIEHALSATQNYWEQWAARCTYRGPWRSAVGRSLVLLKALTYAPTGGIVAAATASLPEFIGGVRNWDYRFCWLRDATFTLYSFMTAGYKEEAKAWSSWLLRAVAGDPSQLQIMYGVAGERTLPEFELSHLRGYEDSRPVRVGNAAYSQFQLDVYGEVMDALHLARTHGIEVDENSWHLQRHIVTFVIEHWRDPDEGIWEIRGPRRHFTHSKVMAWVAMDRAVKAVQYFGLEGDEASWSAIRDEIHRDICQQGFCSKTGTFTQFYGSEELDASLLMLPLVGFLPATDPRISATVEGIEKKLTVDGFVLRYQTKESGHVDGLPAGEGTFLPCSFWLADCLHLLGRDDEAKALFERLLAVRSDLGILAEEYDPRAERQLGNVPQAFSLVGLINTAHNLTARTTGPAEERSVS